MTRMMRTVFYLLAALVVLVVTVAVLAPAQWLPARHSATQGRIELADARGTVSGMGRRCWCWCPPFGPQGRRASLPERLSWQLSPWSFSSDS